jgi:hypothetical protein
MDEVSMSTTRLVRNDAPTVEVVDGGAKVFLMYRCTRDVLPTPCDPRTTILASKLLAIGGV